MFITCMGMEEVVSSGPGHSLPPRPSSPPPQTKARQRWIRLTPESVTRPNLKTRRFEH